MWLVFKSSDEVLAVYQLNSPNKANGPLIWLNDDELYWPKELEQGDLDRYLAYYNKPRSNYTDNLSVEVYNEKQWNNLKVSLL